MTSDDTDAKTKEMVEKEARFGMAEGQIIIVMQDKVGYTFAAPAWLVGWLSCA